MKPISTITIEFDGDDMKAHINLASENHVNGILKVFSIIQTDFLSNEENETVLDYEVKEL